MSILQSAIIIVTLSVIRNVHSRGILHEGKAASRMNGESEAQSSVGGETSQGSKLLENVMFNYLKCNFSVNGEKCYVHPLKFNYSQEFKDNKLKYSQENLRPPRSRHLSLYHRQNFKAREPFRSSKHLQGGSDTRIIYREANQDSALSNPEKRRESVSNSQIKCKIPGSPKCFKNRPRRPAAKKQQLKGITTMAPYAPPNGLRKGLDEQKVSRTFDRLTYQSSTATPSNLPITQTPAAHPPLPFSPDEVLIGSDILCSNGLIFNGNGKCVCPTGYILTRSLKCITANNGKIPRF